MYVMAGPCAHSLWGPRFLPHTTLAILRSLASVLALSFQVWPPLPSIPLHPSSLQNFVFVDAAKLVLQEGRLGCASVYVLDGLVQRL